MKRKPLKPDPEKVRAWQDKHRQQLKRTQLARSAPAKGSAGPKGGLTRKRRSRPPEGPLTPLEWRQEVWRLDGGQCISCGKKVPRDADRWVWQAHHPLPKQRLRREGLHMQVWNPDNGVVLCTACHEGHEGGSAVIPGAKLPTRVRSFALALGTWAADVVDRRHPASRSS